MNRHRSNAFRALHGTAPESAQSNLKAPIPYRYPPDFFDRIAKDALRRSQAVGAESHRKEQLEKKAAHRVFTGAIRNDFAAECESGPPKRRSASVLRPAPSASQPMAADSQNQTEGSRTPILQWQHRVSHHTGEKSFGSFSLKRVSARRRPGWIARKPNREKSQGCRGGVRTQQINGQAIPTLDQWGHELSISWLIGAEFRRRRFDRTFERHRRPVIEWMSNRSRRLNPFQTSLREWKRAKKRRTGGKWVYRGANIVNKARQGQLRRARASADGFLSFINDYGFAVLSHRNRG